MLQWISPFIVAQHEYAAHAISGESLVQSQVSRTRVVAGQGAFSRASMEVVDSRGFPDFGPETRFLGVGPTSLR